MAVYQFMLTPIEIYILVDVDKLWHNGINAGLFNVTLFFKILQRNMVFICINIQTAYCAFLLQRLQ